MRDEALITVHTINNRDYTIVPSEELKNLMIEELQFGVNLPIDQEFELRFSVRLHHIV